MLPELLLPSQTGPAMASSTSITELPDTGSARHGGSFWHHLTEATLVAHCAIQILPCKLNTPAHRGRVGSRSSVKKGIFKVASDPSHAVIL